MDVKTYCPGMVFWANDDIISSSVQHHCYVVLGMAKQTGNLVRLQAMSITSMMDKEINLEVPIKLVNGQVSYIVPYTIFPIDPVKIDFRNFRGMITDNEFFTVKEFLQFLMALYGSTIGVNPNDNIIKAYAEYSSWFWGKNPKALEYREGKNKEFIEKKIAGLKAGTTYSDGTIGSKIIIPDEVISAISSVPTTEKEEPTTVKVPSVDKPSVDKPLIIVGKPRKKDPEKCNEITESKIEKVEGLDEKPERTGKRSKKANPTRKETNFIKTFDDLPRIYNKWEENQIIEFLMTVEEFGTSAVVKRLKRFNCNSSLYYALSKMVTILGDKGIDYTQYYTGSIGDKNFPVKNGGGSIDEFSTVIML